VDVIEVVRMKERNCRDTFFKEIKNIVTSCIVVE
jgi:hypothetical protein